MNSIEQCTIQDLNNMFDTSLSSCDSVIDIACIMDYTFESVKLSRYLIKKYDDPSINAPIYEDTVNILRKYIKLCRLPKPLTVYHGTSLKILNGVNFEEYIKNSNLILCKTFLSTSINQGVAISYNMGLVIEIGLKKDDCGLWVKPLSGYKREDEVILLNGLELEILDYDIDHQKQHIFVKTGIVRK